MPYLVQFERHANTRSHHPPQQLHVREHPLVPRRCDPEITLEQRVQAVQEELHTENMQDNG